MRPFDLYTPTSLPEALNLLTELDGAAHVLAGGTDLLPQMRLGEIAPPAIVSLRRLTDLDGISFDPVAGLRLGARVTLRRLTRDPVIRRHYPVLADTAGWMASEPVRSLATVGGNLCNASPSADLAPPLLVLDARVILVGSDGERTLPLESFFLGPGATARRPGELLLEIRCPPPRGEAVYLKHAPRRFMDLALVGVALRRIPAGGDGGRVDLALGAVSPTPLRARRAEEALAAAGWGTEGWSSAAAAAAAECAPIDDIRASAGYRRRMVGVLVRRGLESMASSGDRA